MESSATGYSRETTLSLIRLANFRLTAVLNEITVIDAAIIVVEANIRLYERVGAENARIVALQKKMRFLTERVDLENQKQRVLQSLSALFDQL